MNSMLIAIPFLPSVMEGIDFTLGGSFTIFPNMSSVNISINIVDDITTEPDENISITLTARVPGLFLSSSQGIRTVTVMILDNEGTLVSTSIFLPSI